MTSCPKCKLPIPAGSNVCPSCGRRIEAAPPDVSRIPTEFEQGTIEQQILELLHQNRKIEAVKLYKDTFNSGLADAKAAVEALEADGEFPKHELPAMDEALEREILELLRQNKKVDAVKRYRDEHGTSLQASLQAVQAIAARHDIEFKTSGCAGSVLLAVVTTATSSAAAFWWLRG